MKTYVQFARFLVLCCLTLTCAWAWGAKPRGPVSPQEVVEGFYKYHFTHNMAFTQEEVQHRSKWLTPQLLAACNEYFAQSQDPDEVPAINGDPFTGSQEYPSSYETGEALISESIAYVPVTFIWKDRNPRRATVVLQKVVDQWLIDDIQVPDQDSLRSLLLGGGSDDQPY